MTATYRALVPIALPGNGGLALPGDLLVEGSNIPLNYIPPSGDVDPLSPDAVLKVYATVPRLPPAVRSISPTTFWQVIHHPAFDEWTLVGSGLPVVNM
jgi:hypothetical protein